MHSTQNWFGISKRRPRRDGGGGRDGRGEEARMDTEKSRVKEEHRNSEKDTGKVVETERKARETNKQKIPPPPKKEKNTRFKRK